MPSRYGRTYGPDFFNDYLARDPLGLLSKFSVCPPNEADNFRGTRIRKLSTDPVEDTTRGEDVDFRKMGGRKVAWIDLKKVDRGNYLVTGNEGAGRLQMTATYTPTVGHVPVYWLPWDSGGAIIRLRIPRKGTRGAAKEDPDIFFTAAINGCSVFVEGSEDNPDVFHCGGDTGMDDPEGAADFWRTMLREAIYGGFEFDFDGEVNKTDYIAQPGVFTMSGGMRRRSTQAALDYKNWLETQHSNTLEIEEVNPWACVMGLRTGDDWKFYIQRNASVRYTTLIKRKRFLRKTTYVHEKERAVDHTGQPRSDRHTGKAIFVDKTRTVCRPLSLSEIYPDVEIPAYFRRTLPKIRHG